MCVLVWGSCVRMVCGVCVCCVGRWCGKACADGESEREREREREGERGEQMRECCHKQDSIEGLKDSIR